MYLCTFSHKALRKMAADESASTGYQHPLSNKPGDWRGTRLRGIDHRMLLKFTT
jgi:hypothetical protein